MVFLVQRSRQVLGALIGILAALQDDRRLLNYWVVSLTKPAGIRAHCTQFNLILQIFAAKYSFILLNRHHNSTTGFLCLWQVMELGATEATTQHITAPTSEENDCISKMTDNISERTPARSINNGNQWMVGQDAGLIPLSPWPRLTRNTQVLWLPQPSWLELSIRTFQSNSPGQTLSSIFPQLFGVLISWSTKKRSVLPRLTTSVFSRDEEIPRLCLQDCIYPLQTSCKTKSSSFKSKGSVIFWTVVEITVHNK